MKRPKVVASIEARMGSSRFPGKMMADLHGRPVLARVVERLMAAQEVDEVVVATTVSENDDVIAQWCAGNTVHCYRGSEEDVLERVVCAQQSLKSDIVVEICGDCPLIDPAVVDAGVKRFLKGDCDLVTTVLQKAFPVGMDVQVFPLGMLEEVERTIKDRDVREHVSLHFYRNPETYRLVQLQAWPAAVGPEIRCVLDYEADLVFMNRVCRELKSSVDLTFSVDDLTHLIKTKPELMEINPAPK